MNHWVYEKNIFFKNYEKHFKSLHGWEVSEKFTYILEIFTKKKWLKMAENGWIFKFSKMTFSCMGTIRLVINKTKLRKEQQFDSRNVIFWDFFWDWKMAGIQKCLRIMFIHDKWHQKIYCSVNVEYSGILPQPLQNRACSQHS